MATPVIVQDSSWFMDSRAIDHVTLDSTQLTTTLIYQGIDQFQVGNGENIVIFHTGHLSLASFIHTKVIHLKNVLCIIDITRNILSIFKITEDNNVLVEFSIFQCVIKDKLSSVILLHGKLKNDLYRLTLPKQPTFSMTAKNKLHSIPIISKVL